jgi:CRP/FNR family transcriptional regulator, cyclic AMP receptor protein
MLNNLNSFDRLMFIRGVPIFQELRDDFLVRLASIMEQQAYKANYTIFAQGEQGQALYIVASGRVRVHTATQELAQFEQGKCFGEMSLFDSEPRSASVSTLEPTECLVLTQQQLYEAIDETPGIAINIIRLLSRRIRELNKELQSSTKADPNSNGASLVAALSDTGMGKSSGQQMAAILDRIAGRTEEDPTAGSNNRYYDGPWPY